MKRNMQSLMDRLYIDPKIRGLMRQLWKHNYRTSFSCQGGSLGDLAHDHDKEAYLVYQIGSGDGWFEKNAHLFGLKLRNPNCDHRDQTNRFCHHCGKSVTGQ